MLIQLTAFETRTIGELLNTIINISSDILKNNLRTYICLLNLNGHLPMQLAMETGVVCCRCIYTYRAADTAGARQAAGLAGSHSTTGLPIASGTDTYRPSDSDTVFYGAAAAAEAAVQCRRQQQL